MDFTLPRSCCYWKESPPSFGGDKKSLNRVVCGLHTTRSHLAGQTRCCVGCTLSRLFLKGQMRQRVGCMPPHLCLESRTRRCVGCTLPRWHLEGRTRRHVGSTPPCWPLEQCYRRERGTNALLPTHSFPFLVLPPPPSPSYSCFYHPRSLCPCDVAFNGGHFCQVMWHGRLVVVRGDVHQENAF